MPALSESLGQVELASYCTTCATCAKHVCNYPETHARPWLFYPHVPLPIGASTEFIAIGLCGICSEGSLRSLVMGRRMCK